MAAAAGSAVVSAGEIVRCEPGDTEPRALVVATPEMERSLRWRSPLLEFNRASLTEVLAAFKRHGDHRIVLGDRGLAQRVVSGTFQADNVEGFLRLAERSFGLRVERAADGRVTLYPGP